MRNFQFSEKEYYHIYNRGVDKRNIFIEAKDINRFIQGIEQFNTIKILGNLIRGKKKIEEEPLVNIISYCLNPNHFHFILEQKVEHGIEKFMHKVDMGYAKYFNIKYKRSGALFQGKFKALLVDSNDYLLYLSAYVNLNDRVHIMKDYKNKLSKSSWQEYIQQDYPDGLCNKNIILNQFKTRKAYKKFAESELKNIVSNKEKKREIEGEELMLTPSVNRFKSKLI